MKNCFIIVNYNDYKSTKHLVDNIIDYKVIDQILIVDNNSKESEKKRLATIKHKKIEIIYNDINGGYSNAINIGSKYLIDRYEKCNLIISNSDIVIMSEEDIEKMIECLSYENVGIVGPQILELGSITRGCICPTPFKDIFLNTPIFKEFFKEHYLFYQDEHYETDISFVDVVSSCFFLISSETLKKINYMDESVFLYYEDFILSKKVSNLGLMNVIYNKVKIKHLYSISVDKVIKEFEKYKMWKRSQYYFHTTYNDATTFERISLKFIIWIGVIFQKIKCLIFNK